MNDKKSNFFKDVYREITSSIGNFWNKLSIFGRIISLPFLFIICLFGFCIILAAGVATLMIKK